MSLRREFSFNGDQVVVVQTDFTDTACASANDATTVVMTYSLGATVAGLAPIDFKLLSASYTPLTAADANSMFDSNACGYRDWQAGIPKDVTGRKCDDRKPVAAGQMAYDVLALSGGKLAFGLSGLNGDAVGANDGSTPEKRPAAVHQESSLTRAP